MMSFFLTKNRDASALLIYIRHPGGSPVCTCVRMHV